jgi:hypothetical protein
MESSNDLIANNRECVPIPIGHTITNERIDSLCGKSLLLPSCFPHHPYAQKQQHLLLDQVEKKSPKTKNKKREMGCLLL